MLIQALCQYYDMLAEHQKVLPEGYTEEKAHYLICLNEDGTIDDIVDYCQLVDDVDKKGKIKQKKQPRSVLLPVRTQTTKIESYLLDHRPVYIFGLNYDKGNGIFTPADDKQKAKKSHEDFVKKNLEWMQDVDSKLAKAYCSFLEKWDPEKEIENPALSNIEKYDTSGYVFCLKDDITTLLQDDAAVKEKYDKQLMTMSDESSDVQKAQCAIYGDVRPIARLHNKIKKVAGGQASGVVLVSYNNPSEESYGNSQSFNSNISQVAMEKYTEALNYLLKDHQHKLVLDDVTIIFWAMNPMETCETLLTMFLKESDDLIAASELEGVIHDLIRDAKEGSIIRERLNIEHIDPDVDFYMLGIKPNSSRVSVKFIHRKQYADLIQNVAKFQNDLQLSTTPKSIPLWAIKKELISPKSSSEKVDPVLISKLMDAVLYGTEYPEALLGTVVRRVAIDKDINKVRAGIMKACINRKRKKEVITMALNESNMNPAYLCGRLFAVLEKVQRDAAYPAKLNRTIKDSYFSSAAARPAIIFPRLLQLSNNHIGKLKNYSDYYNKLIGEILAGIEGNFPQLLSLAEQGEFYVGYYQQNKNLYEKKNKDELKEEM